MFDLKLQRQCSHEVLDEEATIQGLSPNYFSILEYLTDGSSNFMTVRDFARTEGLSDFIYRRDGFTNWNLSTDKTQINWNSLGMGSGVAGIVDGSSLIYPSPMMMVSYRTDSDNCPLCRNSLNLVKDVNFTSYGQLETVSGTDKVRQLIFKALLTELGTNEIVTDYGSTLAASIGQKYDEFTEFQIHNSVERAIQFLINEQQNQPGLPLSETILSVNKINLAQDSNDPRVIRVQIDVRVGNFETINVLFSVVTV